jgi:hypothetical protein
MGLQGWPATASHRRSLWAGGLLALALAVLTAAVPSACPPRTLSRPADGVVYTVELPYDEPPHVLPGPNREQFAAYCRLCHSPRLVLTQPRLPEKKWGEVVRKMVTVYGAPIPPDQEPALVTYLMAVRGSDGAAPESLRGP